MRKIKKLINVPIEELEKYYHDLFNKHNNDDPEHDDVNQAEMNKLIEEQVKKRKTNNQETKNVPVKLVDNILKQLKKK